MSGAAPPGPAIPGADARARLFATVVAPGLCARCGACGGVCEAAAIEFDDDALPRPAGACTNCGRCVAVCPGRGLDVPAAHLRRHGVPFAGPDLAGAHRARWVAQATSPEVLDNCAAGGAGTAVALALLRAGEVDGVGVAAADPERPWLTRPLIVRDESALRAAGQSRYAFVPMLSLLREMGRAGGRYALFVLPCQAMALEKVRRVVPQLAERVSWSLGLFCHYNLPRQATEELLARYRIDPRRLRRFEYRGGAWPGRIRATLDDGSTFSLPEPLRKPSLSYLYALHATDRCLLCPDGYCLFADVALGDFWCRDYAGDLGRRERHTAVLARTPAGARALEVAAARGLLSLTPLPDDQPLGRMDAVAAEKLHIALAFAARRRRRGLPAPDFGLPAAAGERAWSRSPYALLAAVRRSPALRRLALALLFSPAGELAGRLSGLRRRLGRGAARRGGGRP